MATVLYLPQDITEASPSAPRLLSSPIHRSSEPRATRPRKRDNDLETERHADAAEVGSREGTAAVGPTDGDEVMPALPLPGSFSDPKISRWELPGGLQGDVVVEITIDSQGNVVETRLLQGMGPGIDEKVIAALRDWRFRPATRNGIAIPSKHDVHFHFPS